MIFGENDHSLHCIEGKWSPFVGKLFFGGQIYHFMGQLSLYHIHQKILVPLL